MMRVLRHGTTRCSRYSGGNPQVVRDHLHRSAQGSPDMVLYKEHQDCLDHLKVEAHKAVRTAWQETPQDPFFETLKQSELDDRPVSVPLTCGATKLSGFVAVGGRGRSVDENGWGALRRCCRRLTCLFAGSERAHITRRIPVQHSLTRGSFPGGRSTEMCYPANKI